MFSALKSDYFFFSRSKLTCIYIKERQVTQFFPSSYPVDYQGNPTIPFKNLHFATLVGTYLITEEDPLFFFLPVCISPSAKRNLVGVGVCAGVCKGSEGFGVRWEQL